MESIKGHDRSKEKEREVEIVLQQGEDGIVAVLPLTVLQGETHAAHDAEATASVKENILKIKSSCYKPVLGKREQLPHIKRECELSWAETIWGKLWR